mgnify:CR=1 FL=1
MTMKELIPFLNTLPEAHLIDNIEVSIILSGYQTKEEKDLTVPLNDILIMEDCKTNKITLVFEGKV